MFDAFNILLQTTSKTVVVGSHVWVDDPEVAWKDGDVTEVRGDVITVRCTSGEKVSNFPVKYNEKI